MYNNYFENGGQQDPTGADFFNSLFDLRTQQDEQQPVIDEQQPDEDTTNDFIKGLSEYAKESENTDLQEQIDELKHQLELQRTNNTLDLQQSDLEDQLIMAQFYQTPEGEDELLAKYEPKPISSNYVEPASKYIPSTGEAGVNNVGNIRDPKTGQFKSFATPEAGEQALIHQLQLYQTGKTRNYEKGTKTRINGATTLLDAMKVYAPKEDKNNPEAYAKFIAKKIGVDINTKIGDIDTKAWANAIRIMEGNTKITGGKKQIGGYAAAFQGGRLVTTTQKQKHKYSC